MMIAESNNDLRKNRWRKLLIISLVLIAEIIAFTILNWNYGEMHLDSDDSAELRLGEVLSREGGILSDNWYYSTELRVLDKQIVTSSIFKLFNDWKLVRTVSSAILLLILASSFIFMCLSIKLGEKLICLAPVILWPFSRTYLDIVMFGNHYVAPIVIIFITLGLCLDFRQKTRAIRLVMLVILSFISGMGGIRMPVILALPIFLRTLISLIPPLKSEDGTDTWRIIPSLTVMGSTCLGYLTNLTVLSRRYSVMSWSVIDPQIPNLEEFIVLAREGLRARGVLGFSGPAKRMMNVLTLAMYCVIMLMAVRILKKWNKISQEEQIILLFFGISLLTTVSGPLLTTQGYADRYLLMPFMGILVIVAIYFELYPPTTHSSSRKMCAFMLAVEILAGISYTRWFITEDKLEEKRPAFEYILDSGMTFGFGDWDTSDVLTELSDGMIRTCKITNFKNPDIWHWLMEKDFTKYTHDGPVFLIMDNDRLTFSGDIGHVNGAWTRDDLFYLNKGKIVFNDSRYTIWEYESIEAFSDATGQVIS